LIKKSEMPWKRNSRTKTNGKYGGTKKEKISYLIDRKAKCFSR